MRSYKTKIREIALEKNLTLDDIAKSMKLSKAGYLKAIKNSTLRVEHVMDFCHMFNVRLEALFQSEMNDAVSQASMIESNLMTSRLLLKAVVEFTQDLAIQSTLVKSMITELKSINENIREINKKTPTPKEMRDSP